MKRVNPEELAARIGMGSVMDAVLSGALKPSAVITDDQIRGFKDTIGHILATVRERRQVARGILDEGEVYILEIEVPQQNLRYLTLMHRGDVAFTEGQGAFDITRLRGEHLVGADSLDHVLEEVFGETPVPYTVARKHKGTKGPRGKVREKKPFLARIKTQYVIDPELVKHLRQHEAFLTASALTRQGRAGYKIQDRQELADLLGEDRVRNFAEHGFSITLSSNVDWVSYNRSKIRRSRQKRLDALVEDGRVLTAVQAYLIEIKGDEDKMTQAYEYMARSSNARACYERFKADPHRIEGVEVEEVIDALRYIVLRSLTQDPDRATKVNRSLSEWISVAKAARFIREDSRIRSVTHLFEEAKGLDPDAPVSDKVYEGMRQLTAHLLNRDLHYSPGELPFIVEGLWMEGYFTKRKKDPRIEEEKEEQRVEVEQEIDREITGIKTQFVSPVTHLMRRYDRYHSILADAYQSLLSRRVIGGDLKLKSQRDDLQLARKLLEEVPADQRERSFTHLRIEDRPLAFSIEEEKGPGSQITWIVQYYVGVNRDSIMRLARESGGR